MRPGRFDVEIRVFPPDLRGRKEILEYYISKIKKDSGNKKLLGWVQFFCLIKETYIFLNCKMEFPSSEKSEEQFFFLVGGRGGMPWERVCV